MTNVILEVGLAVGILCNSIGILLLIRDVKAIAGLVLLQQDQINNLCIKITLEQRNDS